MDRNHAIEEKMADWLAHPSEFGVRPKSVQVKRTYRADLVTYGKVDIHLVDYTMPDGTTGRGFVNGGLTWSFVGHDVNLIKDDDLFVAYCGWAWLFPTLQKGTVETKFTSSGEEARYVAQKRKEGLTDIEVTERYKIGTTELIAFRASERNGTVRRYRAPAIQKQRQFFPTQIQDPSCRPYTSFLASKSFRAFTDVQSLLSQRGDQRAPLLDVQKCLVEPDVHVTFAVAKKAPSGRES